MKNVLASVATVAQRTRTGSGSLDEFLLSFDGRIQAIAKQDGTRRPEFLSMKRAR